MQEERRIRAWGPYRHGRKWRIVVGDGQGGRLVEAFGSRLEAETALAQIGQRIGGSTVAAAIDRYEVAMREKGNKPRSIDATGYRLRGFFAPLLPRALRGVGTDDCEAAYAELAGVQAVDTHRNALAEAKTFGRWCVAQGWWKASPIEDVQGRGRRSRGKEQLRVDEARKWTASAQAFARAGKDGALAALMALTMGMRSSEIIELQVRDLDDDGAVLVVADSKTAAGRRRVRVSELVAPLLRARADGKKPEDRLLSISRRETVRRWVHRICDAAAVPRVTTHGLRGLFGSLMLEEVLSVSRQLGHADPGVTLGCYITPSALQAGRSQRIDVVLAQRRPGAGNGTGN